jgi:hypothetical protein
MREKARIENPRVGGSIPSLGTGYSGFSGAPSPRSAPESAAVRTPLEQRGSGAAAHLLPAFAASLCPVVARCPWCGTELLLGPATTRLDAELRLCSVCPIRPEVRAALLAGVEVGLRAGAGDESALFCPPYPFGSDAWSAWKRGWWAGFWAVEDDENWRAARFRLDVSTGTLRPTGAEVANG